VHPGGQEREAVVVEDGDEDVGQRHQQQGSAGHADGYQAR
jgi:hypothetical protein